MARLQASAWSRMKAHRRPEAGVSDTLMSKYQSVNTSACLVGGLVALFTFKPLSFNLMKMT